MIDGLKLSIPKRMALLRVTLIFSLVISLCLSARLWGGYRTFPYTPVISLPFVQPPFDIAITACVVLFLMASLFLKPQRTLIFLSFLLCALLALLDLNRLQPWFYIYNSMLVVFVFYNGRVDDPSRFTAIFIILQLIFASVYFYCGLSQLNYLFVNTSLMELILPLRDMMSDRQFHFFIKMGALCPYVLMFIGLGLVISPLRFIAISLAISIHLLLLVFLFPSAQNTNYALWASNLAFMIMLMLLFSGKTKQRYFSPTFLFKMPLFYLVTALFLVLPAFNALNRWPDFLSFNFRSGNNNSAIIRMSPARKEQLPFYLQHFCIAKGDRYFFDFKAWCAHELKADCYPELPVFKSIFEQLEYLTKGDVKELQLQVLPKRMLLRKP